MLRIFFIIALSLINTGVFAQDNPDRILGKWMNEDQTRILEFVKNGEVYDAVIRQAEDKDLVGKKQITGLKASGAASFINGTVNLIKRGKTASCSASLSGDTKLYLKASYGMMSKSQTWTKL